MKYFDYVAFPAFAGEGVGASAETINKIREMDRALAAVRLSRAKAALSKAFEDLRCGRAAAAKAAEERLSKEDKQGSADDVKKRALLAEVTHLAAVAKILGDTVRDTTRGILRNTFTPIITPITARRADVQPGDNAANAEGRADVQPEGRAANAEGRADVQPGDHAANAEGRADVQPEGRAANAEGRADVQPGDHAANAEGRADVQPGDNAPITARRADVQPEDNAANAEGRAANVPLEEVLVTLATIEAKLVKAELYKARRAALAGGVTREDVDAACSVEGDDLPDNPSKVDAYLSGLKKRADDLKKFASLKDRKRAAAVAEAFLGGGLWGCIVGEFLLLPGFLLTPAAPVAVAAVGFAGVATAGGALCGFVFFCFVLFTTLLLLGVLGGAIGAGVTWVHGWVEQESAKAAVTGAGVGGAAGMLLGAAGIIAVSVVCPSIAATACLFGIAAIPLTLGAAVIVAVLAGAAIGAVVFGVVSMCWNHFSQVNAGKDAVDGASEDQQNAPEQPTVA